MKICVFCEIVAGHEPANIVWGEYPAATALIIVPRHPVVPGHVIALPKRHVADFTEAWGATSDTMRAAFQYAGRIGGSCNLITSKGAEATQSVFHLHVHIVPRRKDDGLALPWTSSR